MSWTGITPAWALLGDSVIRQYHEGRMDYERAKKKLEDLGCPATMIERLNKKEQKE